MKEWLARRKYELLLVALLQHLFIGIVLDDQDLYTRVIWPLNMLVLGAASVGVFVRPGAWRRRLRTVLSVGVLALPLAIGLFGERPDFMRFLSLVYVAYFGVVFSEVLRFLTRPGDIDVSVVTASACGSFLLLEMSVFLLQALYYGDPGCFRGVDAGSVAATFMDLVYFSSITLTSIGFGDITPAAPQTKLLAALIGIVGQFYTVVLVGIVISKFASRQEP